MPEPGSHAYDTKRARLRDELDNSGTPDKHATVAANEALQGGPPTYDVLPGETLDADGKHPAPGDRSAP